MRAMRVHDRITRLHGPVHGTEQARSRELPIEGKDREINVERGDA